MALYLIYIYKNYNKKGKLSNYLNKNKDKGN